MPNHKQSPENKQESPESVLADQMMSMLSDSPESKDGFFWWGAAGVARPLGGGACVF